MADITQPDVIVTPKQPEVTQKPKVSVKPAPAEATDKPDNFTLRKGVKILVYTAVAVAALFLVEHYYFTPPNVLVIQVKQQDFTGEEQGTGTVNVDVLSAVGAKIPGRIERMLVDEGDTVRAGQVVATLEDTDMRQVLQSSQAKVEADRMMEQSARAMEVAARATEQSARAMEQERRATGYQTGRAWEREKHLVATGAVSQEEADRYEERDRMAASAITAAVADIAAAHAQIEAAGARVRAAQSEIAASEANVRLQQFNLSQTKIFTYVSGIVTDRPKRSGDSIVSGEAVVRVADPKVILVESYLDERLAGKIRVGQSATVILRGRPKEPIAGRVYRVRPQADPAAEEMTVEIAFPLPAAELQIGQWADVYVAVSQTKNALIVPKTAVMTMGDDRSVLVVGDDNRVRQVKVEPVSSSPRSMVMAVQGDIKNGEWVLTEPMGIKPGQKIHPNRITLLMKPTGPTMDSSPVMKM
jgi:RND family efflux transporter MFP subunit